MPEKKKEHPKEKSGLHPRNKNRVRYDFKKLIESYPELAPFVKLNKYNDESIEFADPDAIRALNTALLKYNYGIKYWDIPSDYLCPPIPGRADYIHHIADLLGKSNDGKIPEGKKIKCLDIGVGSSCIYPIIGVKEYGWYFIGSEIDSTAIKSANSIIVSNPALKGHVEIRQQQDPKDIFQGVIQRDERIDLSICNPPFHASIKEAERGNLRKLRNLNKSRIMETSLNFGGKYNELCYRGGEERFVGNMIRQSLKYSRSCFWFSTMVAKQKHLDNFYNILKQMGAAEIETIPMGQGQKTSRIIAWTYLTKDDQERWKDNRWQ